jgi:hypothetical protein
MLPTYHRSKTVKIEADQPALKDNKSMMDEFEANLPSHSHKHKHAARDSRKLSMKSKQANSL